MNRTKTGRLRSAMIAAVATAVLAPTTAVLMAEQAAAATGPGIIDLADDNLGKRYCDTNSLGGRGFYTSCKPEAWCSDFAKWVWANSGVPVNGLTPESGSFYTYGLNNGTLDQTPRVGDAVVFNYHGGGNADHVGLVSAVYPDGNIQVINGNFGGSGSTTSSVQYSKGPGRIGAVIAGQTVSTFVRGVGVTGSTTPTIPPDLINQVNGDGYADLVGVAANGELFGYNNGTLVNDGRVPFQGETWRIKGSDWSGAKHIAAADVTGDGFADLVGAGGDGKLSVYANGTKVNQGGTPYAGATWQYNGSWQYTKHLAVGDVTRDGYADLVTVNADGKLAVYANGLKVNGTPFGGETWNLGGNWSTVKHLALVDINHDGYADLVGVDANGELFGYNNGSLVNPGAAPFRSETWRVKGSNWSGAKHFTTGEATGDGYGDLIAVEADGSLSIYANNILNTPAAPYGGRTYHIDGDWTSVRHLA